MSFSIISFGEILFDIYPENKCIGGAPFNFAFHLHNSGHNVRFVSRIGEDDNGHEIMKFMLKSQMSTDLVQKDTHHKTGVVSVHLDSEGIPVFIINENTAYDYIEPGNTLLHFCRSGIDLFYFGTLVQRNLISKETLYLLLENVNPEAIIFFDINLRQNFYSEEIIEKSLSKCTVLKANNVELSSIKKLFYLKGDEYTVSQKLIKLFDIDIICITKGSRGASLYVRNHQYHKEYNRASMKTAIDTVGAGDGFAAILGLGLLHKWPYSKILTKADRFARIICQLKGALPNNKSFYSEVDY